MQMNDLIVKDNFDLNEDNEGSYTNKNSIKNKSIDRTANKKKMRRSRIIISENNDNSMDFRREVYDPETKYLKSIISAKNYNDYLTETRSTISKHFLKRKVKAAFEREPLEKNKSFFNIPFLPNANMFAAPPQPQPAPNMPAPQQGQMRAPAHNPNQLQQNVKPEMRNITMNRGPPDSSNIANSLTISNNAKLSQIAAHNKLHENAIGNLNQKPSLNSILNTNAPVNPLNQNLPPAQPTIQKITINNNITIKTIPHSEENQNLNRNITNKNPNLGVGNITTSKPQSIGISNNSNENLETQSKSTTSAAVTKIAIGHNGTSQIIIPNTNNNIIINKQISGAIATQTLKAEGISKSQETNLINYTSQIPISSSISGSAANPNPNMLTQRGLSGKFNIISAVNSATQSSSNVNSIAIPSNALSSSNLNLTGKSANQCEAPAKPKNEEFVSYDTESNDSSPRSNIQLPIANNHSALNSTKNVNVNVNMNAAVNSNVNNFTVAYSASQGKTISEGNISSVNNPNSALSGQAKSLKVSFPIGAGIEEKMSTTAFSQQEISMQNASMMSSKSKQNTIFSKNLTGTSNLLNSNSNSNVNVAASAQLESSSLIANPHIPIDNISDILNDNDGLREKLLKQIVDIYKNNPDKLLNDLGPTDFAKIQSVINSAPKTASAGQNPPNTINTNEALKSTATAASVTSPKQPSNAISTPSQITSKLSSQKITFPSSTLREDQMLFSSTSSSSQNLTMQGISANSKSKKISFDLKNQTSLTLGSSSSSAGNSTSANNAVKSSVNGSMPFMNFSGAAANSNKIMMGNSAAANDSSIHKQLNYQILKTISNKNSSGAANILSPNSNANNLSNLYSNMQGFKGPTGLSGNSTSSSNMSNVFLNSISHKMNPKSSDFESFSNLSHSIKEEHSNIQIPIVQENSVDEANFEENTNNNRNIVKDSENANE